MLKEFVLFMFSVFHAFFWGYAMQQEETLTSKAAKALVFSFAHLRNVPSTTPAEIQQKLVEMAIAHRIKTALYPTKLTVIERSPAWYHGVCGIEGVTYENQIMAIDCDGNLVLCADHDLKDCTSWNTDTDPSSTSWDKQQEHLLIGQRNGRITVIDMAKHTILKDITAHANPGRVSNVESLSLHDDLLVSAGMDQVVKLWDNQVTAAKMTVAHKTGVKNAFLTQLKHIVSASNDGMIQVTDVETEAPISFFQVTTGRLSRMQLLQDPQVVLFSHCNQISAYDMRQVRQIFNVRAHSAPITRLTIPSSNYFASGSFDKSVKLWDIRRPELAAEAIGHDEWIQSLSFKKNMLISGSRDATVRIWDTQPLEQLATLSLPEVSKLVDVVDQYRDQPTLKAALLQKLKRL